MTKPEQVDNSEIELVYTQFKSGLGYAVVKTLNEVVNFKNSAVIEQKFLFMIWHYCLINIQDKVIRCSWCMTIYLMLTKIRWLDV